MSDNQTRAIIAETLRFSTGTALCDSGGTPQYDTQGNYIGSREGYGRAYECNQRRDFEAEDEVTYHVDKYGFEITRSVYHYLVNRLRFHEEWDNFYKWWLDADSAIYEAMSEEEVKDLALQPKLIELACVARDEPMWTNECEAKDRSSTHYMEDMEDFAIWLIAEGFEVGFGAYGETSFNTLQGKWKQIVEKTVGNSVINTYNGECNLDQTLQYLVLTIKEVPDVYVENFGLEYDTLVLLQIHNGADVRGGYTPPRIFSETEEAFGYDVADANLGCLNEHRWHTDDNYHWYYDGDRNEAGDLNRGRDAWVDVSDLPDELQEEMHEYFGTHPCEDVPDEQAELFPVAPYTTDNPRVISVVDFLVHVKEVVAFDSEKNILYCPICGEPLEAMQW